MGSCAQWLSWKCQMSSGTAREHVRVARALRDLPVIRARFAAATLSYAKVRALTRIATPATEAGLAELAGPMTANQLERFARAHRQVTRADDADARVRRRLAWRVEEDGSLSGTFRLPPAGRGGAAEGLLRAACARRPVRGRGGRPVDAGARLRPDPGRFRWCTTGLTGRPGRGPAFPRKRPAARVPGDPADPARCHVEDGPAISVSTAQMIACTAALSWMTHGDAGAVLALGRRRRRPSSAIRRAARERDGCRCRFPGCESRRTDLHHIQHWVNGGRTDLDNLISLCPYHHKIVHDRGYPIAAPPGGGTFTFYRPDGTALPSSPLLPEPDGPIDQTHDAAITPDTIIPPWYGERLDLNHAIWACFANARTKKEEPEQDGAPVNRGRVTIYEPEDCDERYRQYLEHAPRRSGPTLIPIQV